MLSAQLYRMCVGVCTLSHIPQCRGGLTTPLPPISSHLHVASEAKYLPSSEHSERLTDSSIVVIDAIVLSEAASSDEVDEFQWMTQSAPVA